MGVRTNGGCKKRGRVPITMRVFSKRIVARLWVTVALLALSFLMLFSSVSLAGNRVDGKFLVRKQRGAPELVMEPRPGSHMVCIAVAVPAGSAREVPQLRGISHFLEHMVFDGSERYTRKEISDWVDDSGAFLNAFTREETTVYFTLVPSDAVEEGLDILSQMLLHSIFLPAEIEKERKVIVEEIRKDSDNRASVRRDLVNRYLFKGSPFSEPVIGTPETVNLITREELIRYYRRFYSPGVMSIYIVGDFDPGTVERLVASYFPRSAARVGDDGDEESESIRPVEPPVFENSISFVKRDDVDEGLDLLVYVPSDELEDIPAEIVMVEMLNDFGGPLEELKKRIGLREAQAELLLRSSFTAVRFHFAGIGCDRGKIDSILQELRKLSGWRPEADRFRKVKTSMLSKRMFDREKFHYFVMLEGERIGTFGSKYLIELEEAWKKVKPGECSGIIEKTFGEFKYNGCYTYSCSEMGERGVRRSWKAVSLENGCTLISSERKDSDVFAAVILINNPVCLESRHFEGASSLLHLLYEQSKAGRNFSEKLSLLGAEVEWRDNPYIPFDDYLINPTASFIRLLAPADRGVEALHMLVEYLMDPGFTAVDIEKIKRTIMIETGMRKHSSGFMRRRMVYSTLFSGNPLSYQVYPSTAVLGNITIEDVEKFRRDYLSARNMVVSVVSPMSWEESKSVLTSELLRLPSGESFSCDLSPDSTVYGVKLRKALPFKSLYMERLWVVDFGGFVGRGPGGVESELWVETEKAKAAVTIACEVLSRRMQEEVREKSGLAYSTGCTVIPLSRMFVLRAYLGTGPENLARADSVVNSCIMGLHSNPPNNGEVELARKRVIGRFLRRELSSGNRAYMLGFEYLAGDLQGTEKVYSDILGDVSADEVREVLSRLFDKERMVSIDIFPAS